MITDATTVYLRAEVRDLTPTFGSQMGAQLLDVYALDPAVSTRSTEAAFKAPTRPEASPPPRSPTSSASVRRAAPAPCAPSTLTACPGRST
ncbi:hypothetical protein ACIBHX_29015 [Nonomuraea sp. NPDC050536]|uniref:hypothetical protein n=1 Tax=Nonomuraea sp. NPDC050536 TaxID=3364366 RepID=UPI0037CC045C